MANFGSHFNFLILFVPLFFVDLSIAGGDWEELETSNKRRLNAISEASVADKNETNPKIQSTISRSDQQQGQLLGEVYQQKLKEYYSQSPYDPNAAQTAHFGANSSQYYPRPSAPPLYPSAAPYSYYAEYPPGYEPAPPSFDNARISSFHQCRPCQRGYGPQRGNWASTVANTMDRMRNPLINAAEQMERATDTTVNCCGFMWRHGGKKSATTAGGVALKGVEYTAKGVKSAADFVERKAADAYYKKKHQQQQQNPQQ